MSSDIIVGFILLYISTLGVIANWTVFLFLSKVPSIHKSFGSLTRNQALGDAIQTTTVLFVVVPMVLFDIEFLKINSNIVSFVMLFGYEVSVLSHLLLACNRLCAVTNPLKYQQLYSQRFTIGMLFTANMYAFASIIVLYTSGCRYFWSSELHMFMYHVSNSCVNFSFYGIFCKYLTIIILILLIDLFSIYKARLFLQKTQQDRISHQVNTKEVGLLVQTCLQGLLFTVELICYFIISPHVENKWAQFFLTTFAFLTIHTCDGTISIFCNGDFRKYIFKNSFTKLSGQLSKVGPRTESHIPQ
ncbi:G-protein coupled receptors family 1 profile domain-containing protein [Caenorhabditis elegans]|uniref:G-protein coupled receptors family 1 profile domain-containing protein n=1 Tax=Caenorhabditis elegans TaxID=6239 RepID=Q19026_CAEEL|nr:G-protein coupled receptors family 1 profile domain-containing protein [Caenorhabditis elegans]CCD68588.1 G-protein coupled receptors family 1 profile domain-containing protein [Caenorhabditis elegans]|eukprot:NP_505422.1 Serpentine Receptor, class X [Caenorhabditis elegans]